MNRLLLRNRYRLDLYKNTSIMHYNDDDWERKA